MTRFNGGTSSGVTDHGLLTGLADDDHAQYHTDARAATWGDARYPLLARTISTTAPLTGGGDLSANRTLSVSAATESASGVVELATSAETTTGTDTTRAAHPAGVKAAVDAHVNDTTAAHAASAISFLGEAGIVGDDVQEALDWLDVNRVSTSTFQAHLNDATDAHDASAISYAGATGVSATDVEAAIDELAAEKSDTSHTHPGLAPSGGSTGQVLKKTSAADYAYAWGTDATGAGGGAAGQTTVNFGAFPGKTDAVATVTGQTSIVSGSAVVAYVMAQATAEHSADEHWVEEIAVMAGNVVAGTGFTIYARTDDATRLYGTYTIGWSWV
jgi:hypothetical protein